MKDLKLWVVILTVTIIAWAISTTVTDMASGFITAGWVFGGFVTLLSIFWSADLIDTIKKALAWKRNKNVEELTDSELVEWNRARGYATSL